MYRVEELSDTPEENYKERKDENGVIWMSDKKNERPPYVNLVPLLEVLSEALGVGVATQTVESMYEKLLSDLGTEHEVLLKSNLKDIESISGNRVSEAINKVRARNIHVEPGYDSTYGIVEIWPPAHKASGPEGKANKAEKTKEAQLGLEF